MLKLVLIISLVLVAATSVAATYFLDQDPIENVPKCGLVITKFDEYGNIRFADEKARLDNFAIQLMNRPNSQGYIIVYAGRKAVVGEARLRATRARNYLINVIKIDSGRFVAIDGGHREEFSVELWIQPPDFTPPPLNPTVDPSQVEIVNEKKSRSRKKAR